MLMFKYLLENFRHFIWRLALKPAAEQLLTQSRNLESLIVIVESNLPFLPSSFK